MSAAMHLFPLHASMSRTGKKLRFLKSVSDFYKSFWKTISCRMLLNCWQLECQNTKITRDVLYGCQILLVTLGGEDLY